MPAPKKGVVPAAFTKNAAKKATAAKSKPAKAATAAAKKPGKGMPPWLVEKVAPTVAAPKGASAKKAAPFGGKQAPPFGAKKAAAPAAAKRPAKKKV